jgi:hypothetical protein
MVAFSAMKQSFPNEGDFPWTGRMTGIGKTLDFRRETIDVTHGINGKNKISLLMKH